MKLIYSKTGIPIADYMAEKVILEYYKQKQDLVYSNEIVLYAAKVLALRKTIDKDNLEFYYEDMSLGKLNEQGQLSNHPFCAFDNYLDELLGI